MYPDDAGTAVRLQARCLCGHSRLVHRGDSECGLCETCGRYAARTGQQARDAITRLARTLGGHRGRRARRG